MIQLTSFELPLSAVQDCVFCTALEVSEFIRNSTYWKLPYFFVAYVISKHLQDSLGRKKKSSESSISSLQSSHEQKYLPSFPEHSKSNQYIIFTLTEKEKKNHYIISAHTYLLGSRELFKSFFFPQVGKSCNQILLQFLNIQLSSVKYLSWHSLTVAIPPSPPCVCVYIHTTDIQIPSVKPAMASISMKCLMATIIITFHNCNYFSFQCW